MNDTHKQAKDKADAKTPDDTAAAKAGANDKAKTDKPKEYGGPKGPEPTRYGDWEVKGIVSDI